MELQKKGQLLIISERLLGGGGREGEESFIRGSGPQDTRAGYYRILKQDILQDTIGYYRILEQDTTGYYRILQDTKGYYRIL